MKKIIAIILCTLIVVLSLSVYAEPTEETEQTEQHDEVSDSATQTPDPSPDPVPTPDPVPESTPDPVPDPTPKPTPDPVPTPDPAPTQDPTPDPAPDPEPIQQPDGGSSDANQAGGSLSTDNHETSKSGNNRNESSTQKVVQNNQDGVSSVEVVSNPDESAYDHGQSAQTSMAEDGSTVPLIPVKEQEKTSAEDWIMVLAVIFVATVLCGGTYLVVQKRTGRYHGQKNHDDLMDDFDGFEDFIEDDESANIDASEDVAEDIDIEDEDEDSEMGSIYDADGAIEKDPINKNINDDYTLDIPDEDDDVVKRIKK